MFERFTDRARKAVVLALREAMHLGHDYIGTEHILRGLVVGNEGVAVRVLSKLDVERRSVCHEVLRTLGEAR